ncbi:MAG: hypothetical protein M3X11_21390, partial [Acidobacteriota bacterium]|nr:hypothetical protein [Acidobacteriota bacterium]
MFSHIDSSIKIISPERKRRLDRFAIKCAELTPGNSAQWVEAQNFASLPDRDGNLIRIDSLMFALRLGYN